MAAACAEFKTTDKTELEKWCKKSRSQEPSLYFIYGKFKLILVEGKKYDGKQKREVLK
jgi:hypothetical protein